MSSFQYPFFDIDWPSFSVTDSGVSNVGLIICPWLSISKVTNSVVVMALNCSFASSSVAADVISINLYGSCEAPSSSVQYVFLPFTTIE